MICLLRLLSSLRTDVRASNETVTDEEGNEVEQAVPGVYTYTPEDCLGNDSFSFIVVDEAGLRHQSRRL